MSKEILKLEKIGISFDKGKTCVFNNISFSVFEGQILSIIGINGSGKTTLLKIIAGIIKPSFGKLIKNYKKLSYIPQKINIDSTFPISVIEFFKVNNPNLDIHKATLYCNLFGINHLINNRINELSGGELQRVLVISGILSDPDLILLDEPTASIDIVGEKQFYELINILKNEMPLITIILVSHNIDMVYNKSDVVICLHEDDFCCHGAPSSNLNEFNKNKVFGEYLLPYTHNPHKKH